jgi:hypothetical protein
MEYRTEEQGEYVEPEKQENQEISHDEIRQDENTCQ